ncbi:MAG: helix-turn-helix transcriptional regulator [Planctomycetia bacterium]|nr:helix-turn-helix transcriptional regulator [Planctomycetia bacterium]
MLTSVEHIVGVDRLLARVAGTAHDVLQLAPGILDARLHYLKVDGLEIGGGEVNLPLRAQGRTVEHLATITLRLDCPGGGLVNGRRVGTGSVVVWRPGATYDGVAPAGDRWVTVLVPWDELPRRPGIARRGASWRWRTSLLLTELRPDEADIARALSERTRTLAHERPDRVPATVAAELRARWLELVGALFARAVPTPAPRGATWSATLDVRAADRYLRSHLGATIYLADVSRATGVPPRTLQAAFRHVLGCSPMAYLETLRLHAALRALRTPGGAVPETVREVAARFGFRHYPRFSAAFRARFVARPGAILRAARAGRAEAP